MVSQGLQDKVNQWGPSHCLLFFLSSLPFLLLLSITHPLRSGHNRLFLPWFMLFICSEWLAQCHLVISNSNPYFPVISLCLALRDSSSVSWNFINKTDHVDDNHNGHDYTVHSSGSSPFWTGFHVLAPLRAPSCNILGVHQFQVREFSCLGESSLLQ